MFTNISVWIKFYSSFLINTKYSQQADWKINDSATAFEFQPWLFCRRRSWPTAAFYGGINPSVRQYCWKRLIVTIKSLSILSGQRDHQQWCEHTISSQLRRSVFAVQRCSSKYSSCTPLTPRPLALASGHDHELRFRSADVATDLVNDVQAAVGSIFPYDSCCQDFDT